MLNSAVSFSKETNGVFFVFFIISFVMMKSKKSTEYFGVGLFSFVYLMYSLFTGVGILDFFMVSGLKKEIRMNLWVVFISLVFGIASAIMLLLTLFKIQGTFAEDNKPISISGLNQKKLSDIETIFITVTVFLGVACTYLFYDTESIYTGVFNLIKTITTNFGHVVGVLVSFIAFVIGSALYYKLDEHCDSDEIQTFKSDFKTTYWLIITMFVVMVGRRLIENYLFPIWRNNYGWLLNNPNIFSLPILLWRPKLSNSGSFWDKFKLDWIPFLQWDSFLDLAKWSVSISAFVYASLTIRDYIQLNGRDTCFKHDLRDYYITFIVMLMIFFSMYLINPNILTEIFTFIARYLTPVSLLALTSYLVFATNELAQLSRTELVK
jgi:hypothetical protein